MWEARVLKNPSPSNLYCWDLSYGQYQVEGLCNLPKEEAIEDLKDFIEEHHFGDCNIEIIDGR